MNITVTIMIGTGVIITIYMKIDDPLGALLSLIIYFVPILLQVIKKLYEHAYPPLQSLCVSRGLLIHSSP